MLVLGLLLPGFAGELATAPARAQTPAGQGANPKPIKMVVLGDSLSAGLGLPEIGRAHV